MRHIKAITSLLAAAASAVLGLSVTAAPRTPTTAVAQHTTHGRSSYRSTAITRTYAIRCRAASGYGVNSI